MKTQAEISAEARRLDQFGRQYWIDYRQAEQRGEPGVPTRVLFNFSPTQTTIFNPDGSPENVRARRTWRWIEVYLAGEGPQYRLMQEWAEGPAGAEIDDHPESFVAGSDSSAEELLREGCAQVEEERLAEGLAPIVARLEEVGFGDGMSTALAEVEAVIGAGDLSPAARLRTRANALEFLEGRMRPSDFITDVVEGRYERETVRETLVERRDERLVINEP